MSFKCLERYANAIERNIIKKSRHIFEWQTCGFYCCSIRWPLIKLKTLWRSANRPSKVWDQTQKFSSAIAANRRYMFAHWLTATQNRVIQEIEKMGLWWASKGQAHRPTSSTSNHRHDPQQTQGQFQTWGDLGFHEPRPEVLNTWCQAAIPMDLAD